MDLIKSLIIFASVILSAFGSTRVIELSDRFLELRGDSTWMLMFYAPWCGHCKKLEPIWSHVAQALYNTEIRVGKVDCTRFTAMASEFSVKGYPTIMFIQKDFTHVYHGDRTRDDIVGFAIRMASDTVPHLSSVAHLRNKMDDSNVFFMYAGPRDGELWDCYFSIAKAMQPFHFFYSISDESIKNISNDIETPAVLVFKDSEHYAFPVPDTEDIADNITALNVSLYSWVNHERFPLFTKFTHGNLAQLWRIKKYLVMTVVEESKVGIISSDSNTFRDMVHWIIKTNRDKYHPYFQFGWTGSPELANGIAMERLPLPSIIVVNSSTMHHHLPDDPPHQLTPAAIELFLDAIIAETAVKYGGDGFFVRSYRMFYNARTSLEEMWLGNPVLTSVLFGLPLGFLSLICYSIWCADIMDAEEEEDEHHEKKE